MKAEIISALIGAGVGFVASLAGGFMNFGTYAERVNQLDKQVIELQNGIKPLTADAAVSARAVAQTEDSISSLMSRVSSLEDRVGELTASNEGLRVALREAQIPTAQDEQCARLMQLGIEFETRNRTMVFPKPPREENHFFNEHERLCSN